MNRHANRDRKPIKKQRRSMKHRVRSWLDWIAFSTGFLGWCESQMRKGLTILMYHRVLPVEQCALYPLKSLVIPTEAFREQMRWLAGRCRVLLVREAVAELNRGGPFEQPLVAVTFDDGYADSFEIIAPILEENDLRGTFFITTEFLEKGEPLWYDIAADTWQRISFADQQSLMDQLSERREAQRLDGAKAIDVAIWMDALKRAEPTIRVELIRKANSLAFGAVDFDRYRPMTRDQLAELHAHGHEIASHSVTHPILPQLDQKRMREELVRSAECLRKWTGVNIVGFCYPNGDYNDLVERAAIEAGYTYACTTQTGLNQPGVRSTRLVRLSITMQRTLSVGYRHDDLAFRAELCRLREWWR